MTTPQSCHLIWPTASAQFLCHSHRVKPSSGLSTRTATTQLNRCSRPGKPETPIKTKCVHCFRFYIKCLSTFLHLPTQICNESHNQASHLLETGEAVVCCVAWQSLLDDRNDGGAGGGHSQEDYVSRTSCCCCTIMFHHRYMSIT